MDGQKRLKKASSVLVSHLVVAQQSPTALLSFGLRKRCCVLHSKVKDISNLKERITAAVETTDEKMLRKTWTEI